jgi:hypothetical protein
MNRYSLVLLSALAIVSCKPVKLAKEGPSSDSRVQKLQEQFSKDIAQSSAEHRYFISLYREREDSVAIVSPGNPEGYSEDEKSARSYAWEQPLLGRQLFKMGFKRLYLITRAHIASYKTEVKGLAFESYRALTDQERSGLGFK